MSALFYIIINLHFYWNTINSKPLISSAFLIMNECNNSLSVLIRNEIIYHCPKTMHADADIKSVKSRISIENFCMLHVSASATFDSTKHKELKELYGIIERSMSDTKPPVTSSERMMKASKPNVESHAAKLKASDVINFQEKREVAINKTSYLRIIKG